MNGQKQKKHSLLLAEILIVLIVALALLLPQVTGTVTIAGEKGSLHIATPGSWFPMSFFAG